MDMIDFNEIAREHGRKHSFSMQYDLLRHMKHWGTEDDSRYLWRSYCYEYERVTVRTFPTLYGVEYVKFPETIKIKPDLEQLMNTVRNYDRWPTPGFQSAFGGDW